MNHYTSSDSVNDRPITMETLRRTLKLFDRYRPIRRTVDYAAVKAVAMKSPNGICYHTHGDPLQETGAPWKSFASMGCVKRDDHVWNLRRRSYLKMTRETVRASTCHCLVLLAVIQPERV